MSLNGTLQIGRSALTASQAAMQVAGHNLANAATVGFHRQTIHMAPSRGEIIGRNIQIGQGVQVQSVRREVDTALQARFRDAMSRQNRDLIDQRFLTAIETLQNELTDNDLSSLLSRFFNSFSELANNPEDNAVRSVVIQEGSNLANRISTLRAEYNVVLDEIDRSLGLSINQVNDTLGQIAVVNRQIIDSEGGGGQANSLRDQRDRLIDELSGYVEISTVEQASGGVDIFIGSTPILLGGESRGVALRIKSEGGLTELSVRVAADGTDLVVDTGRIGGLLRQREDTVQPAIDTLDTFAGQLIFQVNRAHSQGQGRQGFQSVTGTTSALDISANMNSGAAGLPFRIENGSFFVHVTNRETGIRTAHQVFVNGDAQSLKQLVDDINNVVVVPNVTASTGSANEFILQANPGYEISFSDDTSGALAALGVNTFFTGATAADIDVHDNLQNDPGMLAARGGHIAGSNSTALSIANLQDTPFKNLGSQSLREYWLSAVNNLAVKADAANASAESSILVTENLNAQIQAVSGVSIDEETINLLMFQRQFQAAARFISVIDETLETLLGII